MDLSAETEPVTGGDASFAVAHIIAFTAVVLGVQTVFFSLFLSVIGHERGE